MNPNRLYKAQITAYPPESLFWKREDECTEWDHGCEVDERTNKDGSTSFAFLDSDWEPDDWEDYARSRGILDQRRTSATGIPVLAGFFWPNTDRIYRSRSSAQARVNLIESWGASAEVLETDTHWQPVTVANARRRNARKRAQINRLRERANRLAADMEEE